MENYEPRPMAVFWKLHAVYCAVNSGKALLEDIADATGLPATTIVRVATLLVEDKRIKAEVVDGHLCLKMRFPFDPAAFN